MGTEDGFTFFTISREAVLLAYLKLPKKAIFMPIMP